MAKKSIEQIYNILFSMREELAALEQDASTVLGGATEYGGEISRVMTEQLTKYFIPAIQKLSSSEDTPGSIMGIIRFLDSVPLSMTRPNPEKNFPTPEQSNGDLELPAATAPAAEGDAPVEPSTYIPGVSYNNPVDDLPRNTSFAHPAEEASERMMASAKTTGDNVLNESYKKYQVVRKSEYGSSLGEDLSKVKENVVAEFDSKELAEARCNKLNSTISEAEKDFLKCSYEVVEKEFGKEN